MSSLFAQTPVRLAGRSCDNAIVQMRLASEAPKDCFGSVGSEPEPNMEGFRINGCAAHLISLGILNSQESCQHSGTVRPV
jgi:hypothetical protein